MLNTHKFIIYILICLLATSCGFVEDDPVKDSRILIVDDLTSSCQIDADKFGNIFEELIEDQIVCVESTLEKFKFVRTVNPNILTETDIIRFVEKYFDEPQQTIDSLSLLFKLNTLLLKDEPGQMKRDNIGPFFDLLVAVNKHGVEMFDLVKLMRDETNTDQFRLLRSKLERTVQVFSVKVSAIVEGAGGRTQKINVEDLILDLTKNLQDFELGRELLNSLLFLKKLFLGGPREFINTIEANRLFNLFPVFAMNVFDIFLSNKDVAGSEGQYYEQIAKNLEELKNYVYEHQNEEFILNISDLDRIVDEFFHDDDDSFLGFLSMPNDKAANQIKKVVRSFKRDLVGGDEEQFNYKDVESSLAFANIGIRLFEKISKVSDIVTLVSDEDATDALKLDKKREFIMLFKELGEKGQELIANNTDLPQSIELLRFVQSIAQDTDFLELDPQLINSLFSIKVASVGGDRATATMDELLAVLKNLESFGNLYYDLQFLTTYYSELSAKSKFEFFRDEIEILNNLLLDDSDETNVITIADLEVIVDQFFTGSDEDDAKGAALKALIRNFRDNVLRTNKDTLNFQQLSSSIELALITYKSMVFVKFHEELKDQVDRGIEDKEIAKIKYRKEFQDIIKHLKDLLVDPEFLKRDISLYEFISQLSNSSDLFAFDVELVLKGLSLKSLLVGGENPILKKDEIEHLVNQGPIISDLVFDATFNNFSEIEPKKDLYTLALSMLRDFRSILPKVYDKKIFTNLKTLLSFADDLVLKINENSDNPKDEDDLLLPSKLKRTIIEISERLLDKVGRQRLSYPDACQPDPANEGKFICSEQDPPNSEAIDLDITNVNLNRLLDIIDEAAQAMLFGEVTYSYYERDGQLASHEPVELKTAPMLPELRETISEKMYVKLSEYFKYVAKNFKYFRNEDNYPHYDRRIFRNRTGFNSILLTRSLLGYALEAYGPEGQEMVDPTKHEGIESHHLNNLLVGVKSLLQEMGLWTSNFRTFGENVLLLADLFQSTSSGNLKVDLDESSEFIELLMTSAQLSSDVIDGLKIRCENSTTYNEDDTISIGSECVRTELFNSIFEDNNLGKYFPKLLEYIEEAGPEVARNYVRGVEGFARDVPDFEIPWQKRDFTLVLAAMLNIESTFLRFDRSYDNYLDYGELYYSKDKSTKNALDVYESVIIKLANLEGSLTKLSRTVLFFMVKYNKLPPQTIEGSLRVWSLDKIFKFHFKKIKGSRLNIGSVLNGLVIAKNGTQSLAEEESSLKVLGDILEDYGSAIAAKSGEAVESTLDSLVEGYEAAKNYIGM